LKIEIDIPFIDKSKITHEQRELLRLVIEAHQKSARNNNASTAAAVNAFHGSSDFNNSIVGAVSTLGHKHGPINEARRVLIFGNTFTICPGFGNSFYPNGDPAWIPVSDYIRQNFPSYAEKLDNLNKFYAPKVKPNAAMWTAVTCEILRWPWGFESMIFILARIPVWADIIQKQ
jgi:citrate synthase